MGATKQYSDGWEKAFGKGGKKSGGTAVKPMKAGKKAKTATKRKSGK
jgi:hypothetical protein